MTHLPAGRAVVAPEEEGLDSRALSQALEHSQRLDLHLHSLLIMRRGRLVLDVRLFPFARGQVHGVASVTKSVTATLVGIALRLGYLKRVEQRLLDLLPGRTVAFRDSLKEAITLKDLLTMSSGLACVNQPTEVTLYDMRASPDWIQFALDLPMSDRPGARFVYHSAASHLLSAVVQEATGQSLLDFGRKHLFGPLGFGKVMWAPDPQGYSRGWGHLYLLPEDMAKLGLLYLNDGVWAGERLLPERWVAAATRKQVSALPQEDGYGYLWWIPSTGGYQAAGIGGQSVVVRPDLQLVVVTTGSGRSALTKEWVRNAIVPSVRSSGPLPADAAAVAELRARADALAQPPKRHAVPDLPATAAEVSGRLFNLEANDLSWRQVALSFSTGEPTATLVRDGDELPIGLDGAPRVVAEPRGGGPIALHGEWETSDTFALVYDTISHYRTFRLRLRFAGHTVHIKALEYAFGHEVEFTGSAA